MKYNRDYLIFFKECYQVHKNDKHQIVRMHADAIDKSIDQYTLKARQIRDGNKVSSRSPSNQDNDNLLDKKESILDLLESKEVSIKEKKIRISKVDIPNYVQTLNFETLARVLKMAEVTKNFEIGKFLQNILKQVPLKPFYQ